MWGTAQLFTLGCSEGDGLGEREVQCLDRATETETVAEGRGPFLTGDVRRPDTIASLQHEGQWSI